MRISFDDLQTIEAVQSSYSDYVCFSCEGDVQERSAFYPTSSNDLSVSFLRNHILVHKDALANPQSTKWKASSCPESYSEIFPKTLQESVSKLKRVMAEMHSNPTLKNQAMVFKIMPHREGEGL